MVEPHHATMLREELEAYFTHSDQLANLRNPNEHNRRLRAMEFVRDKINSLPEAELSQGKEDPFTVLPLGPYWSFFKNSIFALDQLGFYNPFLDVEDGNDSGVNDPSYAPSQSVSEEGASDRGYNLRRAQNTDNLNRVEDDEDER